MTDKHQNRWAGKIFNGAWVAGRGAPAQAIEAATGTPLADLGTADAADVDASVAIARKAQGAWAATPFDQRAEILRRVAQLIKARAEEINHWNIRECGSIPPKAEWELQATYEQAQMAAAMPMQPIGAVYPSAMPGRTNTCQRVPVGVVGVIAPWNFPLLLGMRSVLPALAVGNTVVLKPDLQSAVCGGVLMAEIFEEAGLPAGVFHMLPGGPKTGAALVAHPEVDMISFTGSTRVGREIGQVCGGMLKKVALELGGNNPMVILDDADLDVAASCAAWGAFLHQGQICMQAGRHLVHRQVAEAYARRLAERAARLVVGDPASGPVHLGPLINRQQAERVEDIVNRSVAMGARVVTGGMRDGAFYPATVLTHVTPDMPAFTEEIFGPVAPITVFDSDDEAVALVNRSAYGLAAAVHSASVPRATALATRLRAGMIHVNDQTVNNEFHIPFGGMGASGTGGRFGGPANFDAFTQWQWLSVMPSGIEYPF
ncbi:benzaldehyde dehydrogenase [Denitromonas iodatirespirans]|uniref:Benzaldehyde dehydrogenase n=1 Tax=Denitromonas iodatirespirans TaxID=2795389 RepID=A0A944DE48_DENI1|nr:benzaldehyde dehydrogenase [Denitromonas iodatirespirans]MBT0963837.1 benzaldehyde dehydrogenase [Denitromonas iodatirespirans]